MPWHAGSSAAKHGTRGHRSPDDAADRWSGPSRGHALRNGNAHGAVCSPQETAVGSVDTRIHSRVFTLTVHTVSEHGVNRLRAWSEQDDVAAAERQEGDESQDGVTVRFHGSVALD